jgi:hypothetical protein
MPTVTLSSLIQSNYPTATTGTATIDFGVHPGSNEASIAVTGQAGIQTTSVVDVEVRGTATSSSHTADDHKYFSAFAGLSTSAPSAGTGFTIYARSTQKLTGTWTINWSWI